MDKLSYHRHRYPSIVIQQAIWLYFRFPLSYRDVEDTLAERGIDVSHETVRRWALKFGAIIARKLRLGRSRPNVRWHLDEVFVSITADSCTSGVPWTAKARWNRRALKRFLVCTRRVVAYAKVREVQGKQSRHRLARSDARDDCLSQLMVSEQAEERVPAQAHSP